MIQKGMVLTLCLVLFCLLSAGCMTGEEGDRTTPVHETTEELVFLTEEYPPFNYRDDGVVRGIAVDLLLGACDEMGSPVSRDQIQIKLWANAYQTTLSEKNTVLFSTVRLPEREELFKWAGPIGSDQKVIFADRKKGVMISDSDDLNTYRIGVVEGDAAADLLLELGVESSHIFPTGDVFGLIEMIQEDIIDLWCYGDLAGRHYTDIKTGEPDYFDVVYTLETTDLYYAFNKETPDSVVMAFQRALDTLRSEPDRTGVTEYQRILNQYIGIS
jgi:polar amino acid transport system substrate-binding protein